MDNALNDIEAYLEESMKLLKDLQERQIVSHEDFGLLLTQLGYAHGTTQSIKEQLADAIE